MQQNKTIFFVLSLSFMTLTIQTTVIKAKDFDQAANVNNNNVVDQSVDPGAKIRTMFKDLFSVNVPIFYDMVKNGNSLGINVLSGLVKVERGEEAEKSGLKGRKPLSVRVFGVPVYERGYREGYPEAPLSPGIKENGRDPKVEGTIEDEELPINP